MQLLEVTQVCSLKGASPTQRVQIQEPSWAPHPMTNVFHSANIFLASVLGAVVGAGDAILPCPREAVILVEGDEQCTGEQGKHGARETGSNGKWSRVRRDEWGYVYV